MSLIAIISRAISILERVPGVQTAAAALTNAAGRAVMHVVTRRPRAKPIEFGREHSWGDGLRDPPLCAYCAQERTDANAIAPCPGPPPRTQ